MKLIQIFLLKLTHLILILKTLTNTMTELLSILNLCNKENKTITIKLIFPPFGGFFASSNLVVSSNLAPNRHFE